MSDAPFDVKQGHRWFAVEFNNRAWDLVEKRNRTPEEDQLMLHAGHAACHHWLQVGTPVNHQLALCLLANVYTQLGRGEEAVAYGQQCVDLSNTNSNGQAPFDRAISLECLARAHACAGQADQARQFRDMAVEAGKAIVNDGDRRAFATTIAGGNWYGAGPLP